MHSCCSNSVAVCIGQHGLGLIFASCCVSLQAKVQKAQQQREYAKNFHADVVKKLAAEDAALQEAQAARSRLMSLRSRLAEVKQLHAERRAKADDLKVQLQTLKVCAQVAMTLPMLTVTRGLPLFASEQHEMLRVSDQSAAFCTVAVPVWPTTQDASTVCKYMFSQLDSNQVHVELGWSLINGLLCHNKIPQMPAITGAMC